MVAFNQPASANELPPCLLCGEPAVNVGACLPGTDSPFAAPVGKHRAIMYALCDCCVDLPKAEMTRRIEAEIEKGLRAAGALGPDAQGLRPGHKDRRDVLAVVTCGGGGDAM